MKRIIPIFLCLAITVLLVPGPSDCFSESARAAETEAASNTPRRLPLGLSEIDLDIPGYFQITRPAEHLSTTYAGYYITGTSDPGLPVYVEGRKIHRPGTKGAFGVHVSLDMGDNEFTFRQGTKSITVLITRTGEAKPVPFREIRQSSMYPSAAGGVRVGGSLPVECVAPSGAAVSACFQGVSINLAQMHYASPGIPATFRGSLPVKDSPRSDETLNAGEVTYRLKYDGETATYSSSGDVYVAGEDSVLAVEVTGYVGFVYPTLYDLSVFKEKLKMGATDYVEGEIGEYFLLRSGGYLPKCQASILTGPVESLNAKLGGISCTANAKGDTYTFRGAGRPVYDTKLSGGVFRLTLYNTNGASSMKPKGGLLFSFVQGHNDGGNVTYLFQLKDPSALWGYNITFDGDDAILTFSRKPQLKEGAEPLSGIRILLDPGHGGQDPGAPGVAGGRGPVEKDVNLAGALMIREELERRGATVFLTRDGDSQVTLDQRLKAIEETEADLFLSIHHNSLPEYVDAGKVSGMEIYYHNNLSADPAEAMMTCLSRGLDRSGRTVEQSYYRVTLMPLSPAMLLELGFLSNPLEYEKAADPAEMAKVAKSVADGVQLIFA